jgi:hypothetical protein
MMTGGVEVPPGGGATDSPNCIATAVYPRVVTATTRPLADPLPPVGANVNWLPVIVSVPSPIPPTLEQLSVPV